MERLSLKKHNQRLRKQRIRAAVSGTPERPRLSVFISNLHATAQIIDDTTHRTLVYVTTVGQKEAGKTLTDKASWVGNEVAKKAKVAKIKKIVFDRNARKYHGRVKALADAAREQGLEF